MYKYVSIGHVLCISLSIGHVLCIGMCLAVYKKPFKCSKTAIIHKKLLALALNYRYNFNSVEDNRTHP